MTALMLNPVIRLDPKDNVVVARVDLPEGTPIPSEQVTTLQAVPSGHKVAARTIRQGEAVLKLNTVIGYAAVDLAPGTWMHSHNIRFEEVAKDYAFSRDYRPVALIPPAERATFQGFVRADGRVATRNYVGVFVLSNCAATVARRICASFTAESLASFPNVDGVVPFIHELGCAMEMTGEGMDLLRRTMSGYIRNPNTAAALVVGLGCERNTLKEFLETQGLAVGDRLRTLIIQEAGGTAAAIEQGRALVQEMLPVANQARRQTVSAEHLVVGLQCGGSDAFSGLSANPALGVAVDLLVRNGGTAILSETSEIFGLEHTLTARAVTPEVGQKLVDRIDWWLKYNEGRDTQINGRVSPGNNVGGLANVLEKSLGGVKKGGNSPLMEVYQYAYPVTTRGLVFMDTPSYDPVSATGQIAGGATLIAFTTGRGSCFGSLPSPTVKLASNTPIYRRMTGDMDVNCGIVLDGEATLEEMGRMVFDALLRIASGERSKSELAGVGEEEFVPWPFALLQ